MAETFKASWTKPQQSPPPNPILTSSSSASVVPALTLPTPLTPTTLDQPQQAGTGEASIPNPPKLPIKAKPPLPPKLAQSAQVFPLHLDEEDHVHHRMLYLREDLEQDIGQSTDQGVTHIGLPVEVMERSVPGPGIPTQLHHLVRDFLPEHPGLHHPVHETLHALFMERSTMLRHSSPTTRSGRSRPTYQDVLPTIRINERESRANTGKHHSRNRPDPSATLRLRSRSREHRTKQRTQRGLFGRETGVQIRAKARPTTPAAGSGTPQPEPEPPQTFDDSLEMVIPASVGIPPSDWSQLSPELQEQGQEEGEPTPGNRTMGPDRPTMVQKAYEDRSRTKAACELVQAGIMSLAKEFVQKNTKPSYIFYTPGIQVHHRWFWGIWLLFLPILGRWHELKLLDRTPLKCPILWALDCLRLLFFDTNLDFKKIHGTTSKGASRVLAEELIRPGDFPDAPRSASEWLSCLSKSWRSYSITI